MEISEKIKKLRKEKGFSQKKLAEKTGLSIASIQGYEQGKYKPKTKATQKIADALDCHISDIDESIGIPRKLRQERDSYENSYSYASSEEEYEEMQKEKSAIKVPKFIAYDKNGNVIDMPIFTDSSTDFTESQEENAIIIDTDIDENHPYNILLKKKKAGEKLTPEENILFEEYIKKAVESVKQTLYKIGEILKKDSFEYYTMLNESGQNEADKQIIQTVEIAKNQVREHLELLTKIPEYQKNNDDPPEE